MIYSKLKRKKSKNVFVDPDEIFLDSKNIENFDRQQFEGRIEKSISKKTIAFLGLCFIILFLGFTSRLIYLQIQKGGIYRQKSDNNHLEKVIIFAERGIIYDRNKKELAWNKKVEGLLEKDKTTNENTINSFDFRAYISHGFSHILGYVSYPAQDKMGKFWQGEFKGKDGLEKEYNDKLIGTNGSKIIETDVYGKVHSENVVNIPERGEDLVTTLDRGVQQELFTLIKNAAIGSNFTGGAGVILDITNGEVLVATSYPEYNPEILSLGKDSKIISGYFTDKKKVFLDRTISGLYAPGSIVKPIFALAALNEGIIDKSKQILSTGSISIDNPYLKDQKTVFKDWKAHGWTDMAEAIAVSSDVYFYTIGGGFGDQKGLRIDNIEKYSKLFGMEEKTGIDLPDEKSGTIPSIAWKAKNFKGDIWRIGDTYHTAIGQYGFQVTPMEMARAIGAIANNGVLVTPHLVLGDIEKENQKTNLNFNLDYFNTVHEGMRQAVTYGTAVSLNVPYVQVGAKTGTAQIGLTKNKVNSWVVGFFPYENPKYVFTIMMEAGPTTGAVNAASVMRNLLDWMSINTSEYFK